MVILALASALVLSDRPDRNDWTLLKTFKSGNVAKLRKYLNPSVRLRMVVDRQDLKSDDHAMIDNRFSEAQRQKMDWVELSMGTITPKTTDRSARKMIEPFRSVLVLRKASEKDPLGHGIDYIDGFAPEGQKGFIQALSPSKFSFIYIRSRRDKVPKLVGLEISIKADGYAFAWFNKPPNP